VRKNKTANWQGKRDETDVWFENNLNHNAQELENKKTGHACQKPVSLFERPILNNSSVGQWVFEPFLGSGTCLIAAEKVQRKCVGIELMPNLLNKAFNRIVEVFPHIEIKKIGSV